MLSALSKVCRGLSTRQIVRLLLIAGMSCALISAAVIGYFFVKFNRLMDERLAGPALAQSGGIFTAPRRIEAGQTVSPETIVQYLRHSGYGSAGAPGIRGEVRVLPSSLEIRPGGESCFGSSNALRVEFSAGRISRISALASNASISSAEIEPELLASFFDRAREKRRLVRYADLPKHLVDAVLLAEDKRFFEHIGIDPIRVLGAARVDLLHWDKAQGGSTLTMQLARGFFFDARRRWRRKLAEAFMAMLLEQRLSKEQIFELYANEAYLGNRGSFAVHGFGEAARSYFGKDIQDCSLGEACFLAGIIRAPNYYSSPELRHERAQEARDRILKLLVAANKVAADEAEAGRRTPLLFVRGPLQAGPAPCFVDMVREQVLENLPESEPRAPACRIYTTLDGSLQAAAADAVDAGLRRIEARLASTRAARRRRAEEVPPLQAALVAVDVHTGAVRALVGGRDYSHSQLNRVLARRQPGSVFKPFVYAAAFNTALNGAPLVLTPASLVVDEPATFLIDGKAYSPDNYGQEYHGTVTLREALTLSMNVATVRVAESVGYDSVVELMHRLVPGLRIQATPSVALGAYEMTPLEVASAYTVLARGGNQIEPWLISRIDRTGESTSLEPAPQGRTVLDPRVAFLVTSILEDVVNRGTGASVRALGFAPPAAGKTGTSHDGWFAGYTSDVLCVVWVGYDDNRELGLAGGSSAALIWAEFMKQAIRLPGYQAPRPFTPPEGVEPSTVDPMTGMLAAGCPQTEHEYFIAGTEPTQRCSLHAGFRWADLSPVTWFSHLVRNDSTTGSGPAALPVAPRAPAGPEILVQQTQPTVMQNPVDGSQPADKGHEPRKNLFRRFFGLFRKDPGVPRNQPGG
jgi:penicillin-binding protein 1B